MSKTELEKLITLAKSATPTASEREEQRRSFAFGNTHFENERITRETVDEAAEQLESAREKDGSSAR